MTLDALKGRYLDAAAAPIFDAGEDDIEPLIDGVRYLDEVYKAILATGQGQEDLVYITNYWFDAFLKPSDSWQQPIGALLADRASKGVDVRIVLNGALFAHYHPQLVFGVNLETARVLRSLAVGGTTPLAGRVLFDWSGQVTTGSHHQKSTLVRAGADSQAFISGIDFGPYRYDEQPHTNLDWGDDPPPYGWHDAGVRLRGQAVARVWENFRSRWQEARTLPPRRYVHFPASGPRVPQVEFLNPPPILDSPTEAPTALPSPAPVAAVQVLRSRYPYKRVSMLWFPIPGPVPLPVSLPQRWSEAPHGAIHEVFPVLVKGIGAAQRYVYIEDQFLADMPTGLDFGADSYSLYPHLLAAAKRNVRVIFVGSGKSDPDDPSKGLRNQTLETAGSWPSQGQIAKRLVEPLKASGQDRNVVVWRVKDATVHAKALVIDDEFAAVGSANLQSRSMYGIDSELHTAFVDEGVIVRKLRADLWAEHLRIPPGPRPRSVQDALEDEATALGIWRPEWLPPTVSPDTWRVSNSPRGFAPTAVALELVGPK